MPECLSDQVTVNVVLTGEPSETGPALQPRGSPWLECVRGITGSNIIRYTQTHTHIQGRAEKPCVAQPEGKV